MRSTARQPRSSPVTTAAGVLPMTTPPHSEDAEQAVLCALFNDPRQHDRVRADLKASDFFSTRNGRIYSASCACIERDGVADPLTVADELQRRGELEACGGKDYIGELIDAVPIADNAAVHAAIIIERAQRRMFADAIDANARFVRDGSLSIGDSAERLRRALDVFSASSCELAPATRALDAPAPEPIREAAGGIIPAGEPTVIAGDSGAFKSTATAQLALAKAGGHDVWGRFPATATPVFIASVEDSQDVVVMKLRAFCVGHGWEADALLRNVHVMADADLSLSDVRWQAHVMREAKRIAAGLIIFDPWAEIIGCDENSNSEVRPILKYIRKLGRETGAAVIVVAHTGKAAEGKRQVDRIRGASALVAAARSVLYFEYQPSGVLVTHLKMSRAPKLEPFVLKLWIDSTPTNRAEWQSARLSVETTQTAAVSRGEVFVLAQVTASPSRLTTGDLKRAAIGTGVSGEDVARALVSLHSDGRVGWIEGPRKAKLWHASTLPDAPGRVEELTLPTLPPPCPAGSLTVTSDPAAPVRGQAGVSVDDLNSAGSYAENGNCGEAWEPDETQAEVDVA
jgi:hypothetical protein